MWSRSLIGLLLLLPCVLLKRIHLTCKTGNRPFCGEYQLRDNLWSGEEVYEMRKDNRVFQILKDSTTDEHCVSLRQRIKLCGKPDSDVLIKVKETSDSEQRTLLRLDCIANLPLWPRRTDHALNCYQCHLRFVDLHCGLKCLCWVLISISSIVIWLSTTCHSPILPFIRHCSPLCCLAHVAFVCGFVI